MVRIYFGEEVPFHLDHLRENHFSIFFIGLEASNDLDLLPRDTKLNLRRLTERYSFVCIV